MVRRAVGKFGFGAITAVAARHSWWVVGIWLIAVAALNVVAPQLEQTATEKSAAIVPSDMPSTQALVRMADDFDTPASTAVGAVVLASDNGFGEQEQKYYSELIARLLADRDHVAFVLDMYGDPATRDFAVSPDGKAVTVTVGEQGDIGTADAHRSTEAIRSTITDVAAPEGLDVHFSGPAPTVVDEFIAVDTSMVLITAVSVLLITLMLVIAFRSVVAALIPLLTIGIALAASRAVVSALGWNAILPVSTLTVTLMTALVLASGTDYAIFQTAAYHDARRRGETALRSVVAAGSNVGAVLTASALTVAAAATSMVFAKNGMFTTSGPAIAIGLMVTLAVSVTFTPALIAIFGRRGWIEPRVSHERQWRKRGTRILRRAGALTAVSVLALVALAAPALGMVPNGDDSAMIMGDADSTAGYDAVYQHFPANEIVPEYLVIRADHDLRTTTDLAALDRAAVAVADLPNVAYVRSLTRPNGEPLPESATGYQTGMIGSRLGAAQGQIANAQPDLERLASGITELRDGALDAQKQLPQLVDGTNQVVALSNSVIDLLPTVTALTTATTADGRTLDQVLGQVQSLTGTLGTLASAIQANQGAVNDFQNALAPFASPEPSPQCAVNPGCTAGRALFDQLDAATSGALTAALSASEAVTALPPDTVDTIDSVLPTLRNGLGEIDSLVASLGGRTPQSIRSDLERLQDGMSALATGMDQIAGGLSQAKDGTDTTVALTGQLSDGLGDAANYLASMSRDTSTGPGSGFYLPPSALQDQRFVTGAKLLMSPDGHVARMLVMQEGNPYSADNIATVGDISQAARNSLQGSTLADSEVGSTGLTSITADIIDQAERDFLLIAIVAAVAVFVILAGLLRSLVAPALLVTTVLLSFATAAGISVLLWQHLIGIGLHWSVLPVSFMCLVAVGADYSMLFASRVREASAGGTTSGILRTFGTTGSVITTAGVVFAVTMFALMSGSVVLLLQTGFTIGVGLLIDIAVVRTVIVPAALHLLGNRIWWPSAPAAQNRHIRAHPGHP
ncbi:MMPL/RND family transporter [Rhodococcoides fascians]|uniref:MMPL/RND family transporter n=1 Tax=Rhodococcoides fascians TaxID=1828 RepID=UPI00068A5342|nr:RND family transporter [Rhodococcus fascians]